MQVSDVSIVQCDVCGNPKKETNHWLIALTRMDYEGIIFLPAEAVEEPRRDNVVYEDLCGQECAHKRLSAWLDDLKNIDFPSTKKSEAE